MWGKSQARFSGEKQVGGNSRFGVGEVDFDFVASVDTDAGLGSLRGVKSDRVVNAWKTGQGERRTAALRRCYRSLTSGCDPLDLGIRAVDANQVLRIGFRKRLAVREEPESRFVPEAAGLALDLRRRRITSRRRSQQPKSDVEMAQGVLRRGSEERGSDNEGGAAETLDHNLLRAYWR